MPATHSSGFLSRPPPVKSHVLSHGMIAWGTPLFLPTPPLPTMKHLYSSIACINTHPLLHFLKPECLLFNQTGVFPLPVHHAFSCARDCDVLCTDLTTGVYSLVTIPSLRVTTVTRQLLQESPLPRLTRSPYFFFCLLAIIVLIITLCLYGHVARPKRDGKKDMMKLRLTGLIRRYRSMSKFRYISHGHAGSLPTRPLCWIG
jgi:hypothetical protein